MNALVRALRRRSPPLNPLDVWIWEVMAERDMLGQALAPTGPPLVSTSIMPGGVDSLRGLN